MEIIQFIEFAVALLLVATLVGILVKRLRMPYTVGLVLVGVALTFLNPFFLQSSAEIISESVGDVLVPQVILSLLVPPLIFEAAFHIKFSELRRDLPLILLYAVPGVVISMLLVGGAINLGTGLALPVALIFGALIAATDPVAVVALFRTLGVPKRLQTLIEGESLFNDGAAIVLFNLMLVVAATGQFDLLSSIADFLRVSGGGLLAGFIVGSLAALVINRINDPLLEVTLTAVAAYGAYLVAEEFHVSGVLAVVMAGLVTGNIGPRGMTPTTRIAMFNFWEYAAFLANSIVFLLIGLVIDPGAVFSNWLTILLAIAAVLGARAVVIYGFSFIRGRIPLRIRHVLYWGGLRGAISLALALRLSGELGGGDVELVQAMTFGVVLFTILGQGSTMPALARRLNLTERSPSQEEYERRQARVVAAQAAYDRVRELSQEGLISKHTWDLLEEPLHRQIATRTDAVRQVIQSERSVEVAELNNTYREALRAQRSTYNSLLTAGVISEESFSRLVSEVDTALTNEEIGYADILLSRSKDSPPISRMMAAVVREDELHDVVRMLSIMGIPTTQFSSTSQPGDIPRITLLIGIAEGLEEEVVKALRICCREEPMFQAGLLEQVLPIHPDETIEIDNMSVYIFDIDHYEEI